MGQICGAVNKRNSNKLVPVINKLPNHLLGPDGKVVEKNDILEGISIVLLLFGIDSSPSI